MIVYYCVVANHLFMLKKILADEGYTGENFANVIRILSGADLLYPNGTSDKDRKEECSQEEIGEHSCHL